MARSDRDDEHEWRMVWRQRIIYLVLVVVAVAVTVWFVRWLSEGIGMNKIGDHYKQADEF